MLFTLAFLALPSTAVLAAPPADALARIESSYDAAAVASVKASGRSLSFCETNDLRLEVADPVTKAPGFVQARIYEARGGDGRGRTVLVLPPTGGENMLDEGYANALCADGFRAVLVQTWFMQVDNKLDMNMHDEGALRALAAVRHVLDWLKPARATQVGILGTSVGAITSALALGFDARLSSAVLVVGGVGMPEVIGASTEQHLTELRDQRMKAFGLKTLDEYVAALREHVKIDPKDFADFTGPKHVLAFVGTQDVTVPTANQRDLVRLFGAQSEDYAGDHLHTILHTFFSEKAKVVSFFDGNLR